MCNTHTHTHTLVEISRIFAFNMKKENEFQNCFCSSTFFFFSTYVIFLVQSYLSWSPRLLSENSRENQKKESEATNNTNPDKANKNIFKDSQFTCFQFFVLLFTCHVPRSLFGTATALAIPLQ